MDSRNVVDPNNPADQLEAAELEAAPAKRTDEDVATAIGRLLTWLLDADKLSSMGFRVLVAAHKLRPDLIGGISLADIAEFDGQCFGRSAAHKLSRELETLFAIHGIHDRSAAARRKYRTAFRRAELRESAS